MGDAMGGRAVLARERPAPAKRQPVAGTRAASPEAPFLRLQREAGNHAVARLLAPAGVIRRACSCGGGGGKPCACSSHEEEEEPALRRAPAARADGAAEAGESLPADVRSYLGRSRRAGKPLEREARRSLESSFRRGLGGVRVHTGPTAAWAARSIHARAFALGKDIWFGSGEYRPGEAEGRHLIAHEVAHTLEEHEPTTLESVRLGATGHPAEAAADRAADAAVRREPAPATAAHTPNAVRRTPAVEGVVRRSPVAETAVRRTP